MLHALRHVLIARQNRVSRDVVIALGAAVGSFIAANSVTQHQENVEGMRRSIAAQSPDTELHLTRPLVPTVPKRRQAS